eukprot:TRINITY_DN2209_c0_g1_i4.p1 TRINITY_DN2209_c0_g1~~TRINITY_DN2209_c0_g1_i4.p1  ORF type:complete len:372 (-),score=106.38 TRINITY_DN2209_c0_g1_i4:57-1172(-)
MSIEIDYISENNSLKDEIEKLKKKLEESIKKNFELAAKCKVGVSGSIDELAISKKTNLQLKDEFYDDFEKEQIEKIAFEWTKLIIRFILNTKMGINIQIDCFKTIELSSFLRSIKQQLIYNIEQLNQFNQQQFIQIIQSFHSINSNNQSFHPINDEDLFANCRLIEFVIGYSKLIVDIYSSFKNIEIVKSRSWPNVDARKVNPSQSSSSQQDLFVSEFFLFDLFHYNESQSSQQQQINQTQNKKNIINNDQTNAIARAIDSIDINNLPDEHKKIFQNLNKEQFSILINNFSNSKDIVNNQNTTNLNSVIQQLTQIKEKKIKRERKIKKIINKRINKRIKLKIIIKLIIIKLIILVLRRKRKIRKIEEEKNN